MHSPVRPTGVTYPAEAATTRVQGVVRIKGEPPSRKRIDLSGFPSCEKVFGESGLFDDSLIVGPNKGVQNVLVYISEFPAAWSFAQDAEVIQVVHDRCSFQPKVLGVQVGQTVEVRITSTVRHADRFISAFQAKVGAEFPYKNVVRMVPKTPEIFCKIICDVHPWELGLVSVFDHPFFAITDNKGGFSFPAKLPPGLYKVTAIHERLQSIETELRIAGDKEYIELELAYN